ncbi:hypothetical protein QJS10_CPB15g00675 [Acorus calamus]|uniref:Uncharacterized protein n=1 Tax=Acorus calamus TaxID=4465 RepID=A0AAV9D957_ACOCL|nr:hypothetical protein QJS10_CPB15g00675 [Acorus calamus]
MDSTAYFETDEDLRRQILLLLVDEEEGLKDTAPTRAASSQLRLPIESCFYGWLDQTGTWSPLIRLSTLKNHQPMKARRPDMVPLQRESNGTGVFIPRRSINPKRGSNYGGVYDQGSLCKHVVKS